MTPEVNTNVSGSSGGAVPESDPRVYMAAERTFLAWIRTGLAMMGFGFVVARFGVFLREIAVTHPQNQGDDTPRLSLWFGTALVVLGVIVNVIAAVEHVRMNRRLRRGEIPSQSPSFVGLASAVLLAALGLAMVGYLLAFR